MNINISEVNTIYEPFISIQFTQFGIAIIVLTAVILIVTFNMIK